MIVTVTLGVLCVILAYLSKFRNTRWGLKGAFFLIFIFLAFRYDFGNDYRAYFYNFIDINRYNNIDFFDEYFHAEVGWIILNRLFGAFGFFAMIAMLALFNSIVYYRFFNRYLPVKYRWFAMFIYIFDPGFMLLHATAIRQSVAISIFVIALDFLYKKKAIQYFALIGLASVFHTSAIILLPAYLLNFFNWKINKINATIFILIFLSLFFMPVSFMPFLNDFISNYFERYESYQSAGVVGSGLGVAFLFVLFIVVLYYAPFQEKRRDLVFKITIIGFMFIPLSLLIQLIGRIGMYFAPATMITYPIILTNIDKYKNKLIFAGSLIFMTLYTFIQFFYSELWRDAFGTYHTIFSSDKIY